MFAVLNSHEDAWWWCRAAVVPSTGHVEGVVVQSERRGEGLGSYFWLYHQFRKGIDLEASSGPGDEALTSRSIFVFKINKFSRNSNV